MAREEATTTEPSITPTGRRRINWDVRGLLAILSLVGAFALAGAQLATGHTADIPAWAATTVGAIVGFYFGGRGSSSTNGKS